MLKVLEERAEGPDRYLERSQYCSACYQLVLAKDEVSRVADRIRGRELDDRTQRAAGQRDDFVKRNRKVETSINSINNNAQNLEDVKQAISVVDSLIDLVTDLV